MQHTDIKISCLKAENDFKKIITETNEGSLAYYRCLKYIKSQPYYLNHCIRKNGVVAVAFQFNLYLRERDKKDIKPETWQDKITTWLDYFLGMDVKNLPQNIQEALNDEYKGIYLLYYKLIKISDIHYSCNLIFTKVDDRGKISLTNFSSSSRNYIDKIYRSYFSMMRKSNIESRYLKNVGPNSSPDPEPGESIEEYAKRAKSFIAALRNEKANIENREYQKLNNAYTKLQAKYEVLKEQESKERNDLIRMAKLREIIVEKFGYSDFRTLESVLLQGSRIKAARECFDSIGREDVVSYIDELLKQGEIYIGKKKESE